jgi:hypothetical protein
VNVPTWLVILIVLVAVVPGAAVILIGVLALFLSPPAHDPLLEDADAGADRHGSSEPIDPLTPRN